MSQDKRFADWKIDIILGNYSEMPWIYGNSETQTIDNVTIHRKLKDLYLLHASADCVVCSGGYNSLLESMQGRVKNIFSYSVMDFAVEEEQINNIRNFGKFYPITEITSLETMTDLIISHVNRSLPMVKQKIDFNGIEHAVYLIINDIKQNSLYNI